MKRKIINCFSKNKVYLIFLLSAFFIGFFIGIIVLIKYRSVIIIDNLTDSCLCEYLKEKISLLTFIFKRFFTIVLILLVILFISFNKYSCYLNALIFIYFGYILAFNTGVIIICFGFFGIIYSIISILFLGLVYSLILLMAMMICRDICVCEFNYFIKLKENCLFFIALIVLLLFACILEIILLPFLTSTFLINYF